MSPTTESSGHAAPSPWVARYAPLIRAGGTVLDLACGSGRHTWFLHELGYDVVALDRDISKLGVLAHTAGVEPVESDLEDGGGWPLGERRFDGIIVTNYLHRPLFPAIISAVADGGVLIYETFAIGNKKFGKPSNPAFLLQPGELLAAVGGALRVVAYEDGMIQTPRPAAIQRICAISQTSVDMVPSLPDPNAARR